MKPDDVLDLEPSRPAAILAETGAILTYADMVMRSRLFAQALRCRGVEPGHHLAVLLGNQFEYFEVFWAARRLGLHFTPVNWHLKAEEIQYILEDCGATVFVASAQLGDALSGLDLDATNATHRFAVDGDVDGYDVYEQAIADTDDDHAVQELEGETMYYSSGTTGRPKGIQRPLSGEEFGDIDPPLIGMLQRHYGVGADTVYFSPAPLYHAAPTGWCTGVQRIGGTVVIMERFEAIGALDAMRRYEVSHAQFVPTHFVRMLKLPAEQRNEVHLPDLQVVVHAAAPCPTDVKWKMLEWWGPVVHEYYAGSEGVGMCAIGPDEWIEHPGSVGRPLAGKIHVTDENGSVVPPGTIGQIWFDAGRTFEYHNDPDKTASAFNSDGWSTLGDLGYMDDDGFLFLTDRMSNVIISGGVNIYPQEVENALTMLDSVHDVAVVGRPDPDFGERVVAYVQASDRAEVGPALEAALISHCRERLAGFKCPRSVEFVEEIPRLPSGKLLKRALALE